MFVEEANKLEAFIALAKQKSLWIGAFALFFVCLAFAWKSYLELPEKYLAHEQYAETLSDLENEQRRQVRVIELYEASIKDIGPLLQFYMENIQAGGSEATKNAPRFRLIADRSSAQLRADISESEGIFLQGETYQKLHRRLLDGSKLVLELSDAFHASSANMASKAVRQVVSDKYKQVMLANQGIAESVIPAFNTQTVADRHALQKKMGELTTLNRQSWLAAFAMLYLVSFAVFCIARFFGFRRHHGAPVT